MSERALDAARSEVRLRRAERRQVAMVLECVDALVPPDRPVRHVLGVVEKLDLSRFHGAIMARDSSCAA